jgi:RNA polymerase sigma factor (sigma-70 family)
VKAVPSDLADGDLAALALSGREDAYRHLLERHREPVFRLVRGLTGSSDAALEVTQEAFIAGFAALRRYDPDRPFKSWIARIAVNKARDWARRRKVRAFFNRAVGLDDALSVADDAALQDLVADDRAELAKVLAAMDRLPQNLREVLVLRTIEDLSEAETAQALGLSGKAVETRLYRARKQLSELLAASG